MVQVSLYAAAGLLAAAGIGRILFLMIWRVPVQARTCGTSLTEMQRSFDEHCHRLARMDGLPTIADIPFSRVRARVSFEVNGIEHRTDVYLLTPKGENADAVPLIWYDPSNPDRATGMGLNPAAMLLLVAAGLAIAAFNLTT